MAGVICGCSTVTRYPDRTLDARAWFARGECDKAAQALKRGSRGGLNQLCYLLERGTIYHTKGDFAASNQDFFKALGLVRAYEERAIIALRDPAAWTASLLLNDKARPYRCQAHERVLLHTYLTLNYLLSNDVQNARVEILRAYARQKTARSLHEKEIRKTQAEAKKRRLDANDIHRRLKDAYANQDDILKRAGNLYQNLFTYYLSCLVYELGGEINDAYIDAKNIHRLHPNFLPARRDLLRFSQALAFTEEHRKWKTAFGDLDTSIPKGYGEIVLLHQCGIAPIKREIYVPLPVPIKGRVNLISAALPKYADSPAPVRAARLVLPDKSRVTTQPLMNVEAAAKRNLRDHVFSMAIRQVIRMGINLAAQEYVHYKAGDLGVFPLTVFNMYKEQADLRGWFTLPREFQALRTPFPAGTHTVRIELVGANGKTRATVTVPEVRVRAGGVTIISLRSMGNRGMARVVVF